MRVWLAVLSIVPGTALAEPVGPPAPVAIKASAAQQAMANYRRDFAALPIPKPCIRPKGNEVIVCGVGGRGGSPERLPLPDERGLPDHARTAIGEIRPDMSAPPGMGTCLTQDQGARCGGGVDVIAAALAGVQIVRAIIDPESVSDAADARMQPRR
jgi:hypothetical protein